MLKCQAIEGQYPSYKYLNDFFAGRGRKISSFDRYKFSADITVIRIKTQVQSNFKGRLE
jgi:hypothetical protein